MCELHIMEESWQMEKIGSVCVFSYVLYMCIWTRTNTRVYVCVYGKGYGGRVWSMYVWIYVACAHKLLYMFYRGWHRIWETVCAYEEEVKEENERKCAYMYACYMCCIHMKHAYRCTDMEVLYHEFNKIEKAGTIAWYVVRFYLQSIEMTLYIRWYTRYYYKRLIK